MEVALWDDIPTGTWARTRAGVLSPETVVRAEGTDRNPAAASPWCPAPLRPVQNRPHHPSLLCARLRPFSPVNLPRGNLVLTPARGTKERESVPSPTPPWGGSSSFRHSRLFAETPRNARITRGSRRKFSDMRTSCFHQEAGKSVTPKRPSPP